MVLTHQVRVFRRDLVRNLQTDRKLDEYRAKRLKQLSRRTVGCLLRRQLQAALACTDTTKCTAGGHALYDGDGDGNATDVVAEVSFLAGELYTLIMVLGGWLVLGV